MSDTSSFDVLPVATQCAIASSLPSDENAIKNVFLVYCLKSQSKGTSFLLSNGVIISNAHVVHGARDSEILLISSNGKNYKIKKSIRDERRDLAILITEVPIQGGLELDSSPTQTRQEVHTWGFPLTHNGPAPLLSTGYISGFRHTSEEINRLVINSAINKGNSGGPLFSSNADKVIGVIVAKWQIPLTQFQSSALQALKNNKNGLQFPATNHQGQIIPFSESQLVADLLEHYWNYSQVMIGETIPVNELNDLLNENSLPVE